MGFVQSDQPIRYECKRLLCGHCCFLFRRFFLLYTLESFTVTHARAHTASQVNERVNDRHKLIFDVFIFSSEEATNNNKTKNAERNKPVEVH